MTDPDERSGFLEGIGALTLIVVGGFLWWHLGGWIGGLTKIDWMPYAIRFMGYGFALGISAK